MVNNNPPVCLFLIKQASVTKIDLSAHSFPLEVLPFILAIPVR